MSILVVRLSAAGHLITYPVRLRVTVPTLPAPILGRRPGTLAPPLGEFGPVGDGDRFPTLSPMLGTRAVMVMPCSDIVAPTLAHGCPTCPDLSGQMETCVGGSGGAIGMRMVLSG